MILNHFRNKTANATEAIKFPLKIVDDDNEFFNVATKMVEENSLYIKQI